MNISLSLILTMHLDVISKAVHFDCRKGSVWLCLNKAFARFWTSRSSQFCVLLWRDLRGKIIFEFTATLDGLQCFERSNLRKPWSRFHKIDSSFYELRVGLRFEVLRNLYCSDRWVFRDRLIF